MSYIIAFTPTLIANYSMVIFRSSKIVVLKKLTYSQNCNISKIIDNWKQVKFCSRIKNCNCTKIFLYPQFFSQFFLVKTLVTTHQKEKICFFLEVMVIFFNFLCMYLFYQPFKRFHHFVWVIRVNGQLYGR